jgi:hypothetical protein
MHGNMLRAIALAGADEVPPRALRPWPAYKAFSAQMWDFLPDSGPTVRCACLDRKFRHRKFRRKVAFEDAVEFHACVPLEASMRGTNGIPLGCSHHRTGVHCKLCPNTE